MKRILVATDLKQGNEIAFLRAIQLSQTSGASLHVMHVPHQPFHPGASLEATEWRDQIITQIQDFVRQHSHPNAPPAIVHLEDRGDVPATIVQRARLLDAGLLVIGRSMRPEILPDAVFLRTGQILANSPVPVLVALTREPGKYRKILLEGDLSVSPTQALRLVREFGMRGQLKLFVRSAAESGNSGLFGRILNSLHQRRKERYRASARLAFESDGSAADHLSIEFRAGDIGHELFEKLTDKEFDLIGIQQVRRKLRHQDPKVHVITALQQATCDVLANPF